jgi:hypothetical protein
MTSMRVSSTPLIASSLIVGDSGLGVEGINIPGTGKDGPSALFQYVTLPDDNDVEFRWEITTQPTLLVLESFEDGSFIATGESDSFGYNYYCDGVSQGSDTVNVQIGGGAAFELSPNVVNSSSASLSPEFVFNSAFNLSPNTVNSSSISLDPSFTFTSAFVLSPDVVNSSSVSLDPAFNFLGAFNLSPSVVNSNSDALNPIFSFGQTQVIGTVTASYAPDLYTVTFKS